MKSDKYITILTLITVVFLFVSAFIFMYNQSKECDARPELSPCGSQHIECYDDCLELNMKYWKFMDNYGDDSCTCLRGDEPVIIW